MQNSSSVMNGIGSMAMSEVSAGIVIGFLIGFVVGLVI